MSGIAGTSDWRESPSLTVVERLQALGADVVACDPHLPDVGAQRLGVPLVPFDADQLGAADLVLVLVDHPEFDPLTIASSAKLVFDAKDLLRGHAFTGEVL
mgnify:CR=1 FL=1